MARLIFAKQISVSASKSIVIMCDSRDSIVASDLLPTSRTKVIEQSPLISENSGYETIQIYR
jgi:hypothetical protein